MYHIYRFNHIWKKINSEYQPKIPPRRNRQSTPSPCTGWWPTFPSPPCTPLHSQTPRRHTCPKPQSSFNNNLERNLMSLVDLTAFLGVLTNLMSECRALISSAVNTNALWQEVQITWQHVVSSARIKCLILRRMATYQRLAETPYPQTWVAKLGNIYTRQVPKLRHFNLI